MNKVAKRLNTFLDLAFNDEGDRISENIIPTPSKKYFFVNGVNLKTHNIVT